jgi:hypothetical protein
VASSRGIAVDQRGELARQRVRPDDLVDDAVATAGGDGRPRLQGAERTRLLEAVLGEGAHLRAGVLAQIGRNGAERLAQVVGAAHERAARVDGNAEPLVRVEDERVRPLHAAVAGGDGRVEHAEAPVRPVDVEPQPLGGRDVG